MFILKKRKLLNELKPWKVKGWVIGRARNGQFVADMEKVLEIYKLPYDPKYPLVCMGMNPQNN